RHPPQERANPAVPAPATDDLALIRYRGHLAEHLGALDHEARDLVIQVSEASEVALLDHCGHLRHLSSIHGGLSTIVGSSQADTSVVSSHASTGCTSLRRSHHSHSSIDHATSVSGHSDPATNAPKGIQRHSRSRARPTAQTSATTT